MPYRTASEVLPLIVTRGTGLVVSVILNVCEDSLPFHSLSGRTVRMKPESLLFATRHARVYRHSSWLSSVSVAPVQQISLEVLDVQE